jgi:trimeric autotransporter adhesin
MAATNFTPISLYYSTTAAAVPSAGNLVAGELALNTVDEKLYFKNSAGTVKLLAANITPVANGGTGLSSTPSNGQLDIGNGTGFTRATLTAGSGVTITNGSGAITINATGTGGDVVGPASATANGIALFNSTTGKLIKDSAASDGLIYGHTVGRGNGALATNLAVGNSALAGANSGTGSNTGVGYQALNANETGAQNAAFGQGALFKNTTANYNNAFGQAALYNNLSGTSNSAFGQATLFNNTTANDNTAVGFQAGYANVTSTNLTVVGGYAGTSATAGYLTAVGTEAARATTLGYDLVAIGDRALRNNTTGIASVAVGGTAFFSNITSSYGVAVGYQAGYSSTADYNTFIGYRAGYSTTGEQNTFLGKFAGNAITTGNTNTIVGAYNGNQGSLDIRTLSGYVVLSDGGGTPRFYTDTNGIANLRSSMLEQMTISATAATGTINFDAASQSVLYYTSNASGNFTMNVRATSGTTLNNSMVVGQSLTVAFLNTNGGTAYYQTGFQVDGSSVTPKWQGGTAPTAGNASSIDSYVYTIIKTAASTFTVLAAQTKFA